MLSQNRTRFSCSDFHVMRTGKDNINLLCFSNHKNINNYFYSQECLFHVNFLPYNADSVLVSCSCHLFSFVLFCSLPQPATSVLSFPPFSDPLSLNMASPLFSGFFAGLYLSSKSLLSEKCKAMGCSSMHSPAQQHQTQLQPKQARKFVGTPI